MPLKKTNVIIEGLVFVPPDPGDHIPDMGAHPEHPIYYPVPIPPDVVPPGIWGGANEPFPTPPIYIPVQPPGHIWGGANEPFPTPPIYIPVPRPPDGGPGDDLGIWGGANEPFPTPPIYLPIRPGDGPPELPDLPPWNGLTDEQKEALRSFLEGNLPPYEGPPLTQPV
jgi:hypothetical protein